MCAVCVAELRRRAYRAILGVDQKQLLVCVLCCVWCRTELNCIHRRISTLSETQFAIPRASFVAIKLDSRTETHSRIFQFVYLIIYRYRRQIVVIRVRWSTLYILKLTPSALVHILVNRYTGYSTAALWLWNRMHACPRVSIWRLSPILFAVMLSLKTVFRMSWSC